MLVAQYEMDKFLQKIILLLKKPGSTTTNCLPTTETRCLCLDEHDFMHSDERSVIPKTLHPTPIHTGIQNETACSQRSQMQLLEYALTVVIQVRTKKLY